MQSEKEKIQSQMDACDVIRDTQTPSIPKRTMFVGSSIAGIAAFLDCNIPTMEKIHLAAINTRVFLNYDSISVSIIFITYGIIRLTDYIA